MDRVIEIIKIFPCVVIAIVIHEFAHAYVAYLMGDSSAKDSGRVSLNPFKHLDPLGIITLMIFRFGWAKPVPIDTSRFKNYNLGLFLVSIAGIVANLLLAFLLSLILKHVKITNQYIFYFVFVTMIININLAIFNLIPLPPLDGSNIILSFFSKRTAYEISRYSKYSYILLLVLIFTGNVGKILSPLITKIVNFLLS
ncbi:MAG: site-2 protease family protein [Tissierellia bacterium]|nr:site-2 protease family protein [Tissierellia bacterium]